MVNNQQPAGLAQLGERSTEDAKVMCSIHINRKPQFLSIDTILWPLARVSGMLEYVGNDYVGFIFCYILEIWSAIV